MPGEFWGRAGRRSTAGDPFGVGGWQGNIGGVRVGPSVPQRDSITYMPTGVIQIVAAVDSPGHAGIVCWNLLVVISVEK